MKTLVAGIGISYTFFVFAVIGALSFVFVWTMVPETRGRSLEELEEQFGAARQKSTEPVPAMLDARRP